MPSPSWADVFFLAFYPLILIGLLQFPGAVTTKAEGLGFALDAVAVLFGSGMVIAYVLIVPTLERPAATCRRSSSRRPCRSATSCSSSD